MIILYFEIVNRDLILGNLYLICRDYLKELNFIIHSFSIALIYLIILTIFGMLYLWSIYLLLFIFYLQFMFHLVWVEIYLRFWWIMCSFCRWFLGRHRFLFIERYWKNDYTRNWVSRIIFKFTSRYSIDQGGEKLSLHKLDLRVNL